MFMKALTLSAALAVVGLACMSHEAVLATVTDPSQCSIPYPEHIYSFEIDWRFNEAQEALIIDAMRVWTRSTGNRVQFVRNLTGLRSDIVFLWCSSKDHLPDHDKQPTAVGMFLDGKVWLSVEDLDTREYFLPITVHEIGHFLDIYQHPVHAKQPEADAEETTCMAPNVDPECLQDGLLPLQDRLQFCRRYKSCSCGR